ncbi:MAG: response regulator [Elusimicrobia bacterium]|nr:response regulator [Elusimicrobiota bacterium]
MTDESPGQATRIIVADDEPDLLALLKSALAGEGFLVETACNGREAIAAIRANPPDIVVLDLSMPFMNGFEVCQAVRRDPLLEHLPIIILSATTGGPTKVEGLNLGADDFITKPVDMNELLARVRMIIRRTRQGLDANPLSHLPGNVSIERHIEEALADGRPLAVLYVDINQFKAYNDAYGYDSGDHVIKTTSRLLIRVATESSPPCFIGHIGGDDFILIAAPGQMENLARRIISEFDAMSLEFYNEVDRARRRIVSTDRRGQTKEYPLLSIAVGICHNKHRKLTSYAQISQYGAELKKHAKSREGSAFVVDRRRDDGTPAPDGPDDSSGDFAL